MPVHVFRDARSLFTLLHRDHVRIASLMAHIIARGGAPRAERDALFADLRTELQAHAEAEEKLFYAVLRQSVADQGQLLQARIEHEQMEALLARLDACTDDEEVWREQFVRLKALVEVHVAEEESEIFESARQVLEPSRRRELASEIEAEEERIRHAAGIGTSGAL